MKHNLSACSVANSEMLGIISKGIVAYISGDLLQTYRVLGDFTWSGAYRFDLHI